MVLLPEPLIIHTCGGFATRSGKSPGYLNHGGIGLDENITVTTGCTRIVNSYNILVIIGTTDQDQACNHKEQKQQKSSRMPIWHYFASTCPN